MATELTHKLTISGPEGFSGEFNIPLGISSLGRQVGNDLHLDSPQVSRRHAKLVCTGTECEISDEGSSNGTYCNGEKLTPKDAVILSPGDEIKVGPFTMIYTREAQDISAVKPSKEVGGVPQPEGGKPKRKRSPQRAPRKAPDDAEPPAEKKTGEEPASPPPGVPPPAPLVPEDSPPAFEPIPPGLGLYSTRLINFLPGIYHTDFMSRLLAMFEAILVPIEWNVDNFDLFLDPGSSPPEFLPWLANWFSLFFDPTWTEAKRRAFLKDAHRIFSRRGTKWALSRTLEIYTGQTPEIRDEEVDLDAHTFEVDLMVRKREVNPELVEALIDAHKPAHTLYTVNYKR